MAFLDELQSTFTGVAGKAGPAVVRIGGWRGGAGLVVADGAIVTNAHNVRGDEMAVTFGDGRRADARLAGIDVDGDLAVLLADTGASPAIEWSSVEPEIGTPVFAVAPTSSGARATFGFVSGAARAFRGPRGRRISGSLEHTAPLAPGSSGSALVDREGKLLGINTNRVGGGFYLALPADAALRSRIAALQRGESSERPRLGIGIAPAWVANRMRRSVGLPERAGLLVREVEPGSPAEAAGVREGDLIVAAAGKAVAGPDDLYDRLGEVRDGGKLKLDIVRGADELTVEASFSGSAAAS